VREHECFEIVLERVANQDLVLGGDGDEVLHLFEPRRTLAREKECETDRKRKRKREKEQERTRGKYMYVYTCMYICM